METKVVLDGGVAQGYPADQEALKADIIELKKRYTEYKTSHKPEDDDVTKLTIGKACKAVYDKAKLQLATVQNDLLNIKPDEMVPSELEVKMGPLKKVQRITQKAVHYAVEKGQDALQLGNVNDILRATIVLPLSFLRQDEIGGKMIDIVDEAFDGQVVSVKNRFVQTRYPKIMEYNGREMSDSLVKDITEQVAGGLHMRDTFYRDMQLLVKLPNATFANGNGLSHVVMEVQLAAKPYYEVKTSKNPDAPSGHDMYKIVRAVAEACEYMHWTKYGKSAPALADAAQYYAPLPDEYWESFTSHVTAMWDMYKNAQKLFTPHFDQAISESTWYARASEDNRINKKKT